MRHDSGTLYEEIITSEAWEIREGEIIGHTTNNSGRNCEGRFWFVPSESSLASGAYTLRSAPTWMKKLILKTRKKTNDDKRINLSSK